MKDYKRDIVDEAQQHLTGSSDLTHKSLISQMCNEVVSLRVEIERLEKLLNPTRPFIPGWPTPTMRFTFNDDGSIGTFKWVSDDE